MIYIVMGTQGELIKLAPVALELAKREIDFVPVYTGQHGRATSTLSRVFGLPEPRRFLRYAEVSTTIGGIGWFARTVMSKFPSYRNRLGHGRDIVLVHGDTLSTVLGLVLAKKSHLRVAHVEAGLRSHNFLDPFPEEIIRTMVDASSDILFAPSAYACENLRKMKLKGRIHNTGGNTIVDAIRLSRRLACPTARVPKPYALVSIHRFETIISPRRLASVLRLVRFVAQFFTTVFIIPKSTRDKIARLGLDKYVSDNHNIVNLEPLIYPSFIKLLTDAEFVLTDGGGVQEESFYLGKPCLLLRKRTEHMEGLGAGVWVSGLSEETVRRFLREYQALAHKPPIDEAIHPSQYIVEVLLYEQF